MVDKVCKEVPAWLLPKESKVNEKDAVVLPNPSTVKEKDQELPSTSDRQAGSVKSMQCGYSLDAQLNFGSNKLSCSEFE